MELQNEIKNNIKIENQQNDFLNSIIGKTINSAIDIGLKTILPDLIENQIIDIKNALLENGLKGGIKSAIDNTIDLAKSAQGILTGEFQNINQIKIAISDGGILDTISELLDKASNKAYQKGYINSTINTILKKGKDVLLDNVTNSLKDELDNQSNSIDRLGDYIENWKQFYNDKNFEGMEKEFNKIEKILNKVVPFEKIIKETRQIENLHNLIRNNGHNFNISNLEQELAKKFE